MLRTALGAAAVALVVSSGVAAPPVVAAERHDPLDGLAMHPEWGSVKGKGGVLRRGCKKYTYSYSINPPKGIWAIEVFLTGPGGVHLAAGGYMEGYDPQNGTGTYTLCRNSTTYGRFRIDAKLSVDDGFGKITEGRLPADHFRLRRPR